MALVVASLLAALLVIDIGIDAVLKVAGFQWQRATTLRRLAAAFLWLIAWVAAARPPSAHGATPPPSVRMGGAVGESTHAHVPISRTYEVQRGDCLWSIAEAILIERGREPQGADIAELWKAIYRANRDVIGDDPDLILPGQILELTEV